MEDEREWSSCMECDDGYLGWQHDSIASVALSRHLTPDHAVREHTSLRHPHPRSSVMLYSIVTGAIVRLPSTITRLATSQLMGHHFVGILYSIA